MVPFQAVSRRLPLALSLILVAGCPRSQGPRGGGGTGGEGGGGPRPVPKEHAAIFAASDLPELLPRPLPNDPLAVTIHRLSNGMTVYISTDRQQPRFTAWVAVRAGGRHDPADSTGLAHYLEHMVFKGTKTLGTTDFAKEKPHLDRIAELYSSLRGENDAAKRAAIFRAIDGETQKSAAYAIPNEMDQLFAALGIASVNAFTGDDMTVYTVDVPSNKLEQWAAIEADRFAAAQFRLFLPELESVYEEKNRSLDSPDNRVYEALIPLLFPGHPYGTQTTIGTVEHLKNPAYRDMEAFYRRWYAPNNMAILLAGDIDAVRALPVLERAFASLTPRKLEAAPPGKVAPIAQRVEAEVKAPGEQSLMLGWQTVAAGHPDRPALEVMDLLMDNSVSGLINLELILTQKLPRASSSANFMTEAGAWTMNATAREGQSLAEVEKLLLGVVDKLRAGEFTQADLDAIVLNEEIDEKEGLESNESRVGKMLDSYIGRVPWSVSAAHIDRMRKVTREDVMRVAGTYLTGRYVAVKRLRGLFEPPRIEKPTITPIGIDTARESLLAGKVKAMPVEPLEPEWLVEGSHYLRFKLPGGGMVASRNKRHDLFTVTYEFELGSKRRRLLCHALDLLDRSGAKGLPAADLKRKLFAMGTSIATSCDADESQISVSGIDRNLESSVDLLETWLRTAEFDAKVVAALAANEISQRKDEVQEPQVIASALHEYVTRGADSRYLTVPSNRELKSARGPALRKLLAELPDHQHRVAYFGPRDAAAAAPLVAIGQKHRKVAPRDPLAFRIGKGTRIHLVDRPVAQSQVRLAVPHAPLDRGKRVVARLYSEYMGGNMGALVFQEIREARGLAYTANAGFRTGLRPVDQSALVGTMGTQADKTIDALTTLLSLLRKMPLQEQRFRVARDTLDEEYRSSRVDPRAAPLWVFGWDDQGEKSDPRPREWDQLKKLTGADLAAFALEVASGATLISILGHTKRFDQAALGEVGHIENVPVSKLFGY
jgi:predicted Zn-dependent peptidase